jgi:NAD(P)-dependent dehydrogenase (short-subunit alcohol dehydrogenase family)
MKTILITGGARGIGAETARQLVARGHNVALVGLEPELLEQRCAELGDRAAWWEADVTDLEAMERATAAAAERFGGLDVVLANAGIAGGGPVESMDADAWAKIIEVNLLGVYRTVRAALPYVTARSGYVLPIASLAAAMHGPGMSAYCATKAGVEAFANCLRTEVAPTGTAVGCAYFSFIDTDMVRRGMDSKVGERFRERAGRAFRPAPVEDAGAALVRAIENRARHAYAPRWVLPVLYLRTVLQPIQEKIAQRDVAEMLELSRQEPTTLTTEQPEKQPQA